MKMFSAREDEILKIIGRKRLTLDEIITSLFNNKNRPFETRISVGNSVRRIIKKCSYHKLLWTLDKTRQYNKLTIKRVRRSKS